MKTSFTLGLIIGLLAPVANADANRKGSSQRSMKLLSPLLFGKSAWRTCRAPPPSSTKVLLKSAAPLISMKY